jgi:pimeloyl-ACP methyl ester carboxylesterase
MGYEPVVDAELTLSDGRNLAYCIWGDPNGRPLFLFHGSPGSRLFAPDPATTEAAGIRLITIDRPGYGGSHRRPGRQILDWPGDVAQLAHALGIQEFDVLGHSSGGPYALGCASTMPDRVKRVALVSCVPPRPEPDPFSDEAALDRVAWHDPESAAETIGRSAAWLLEAPERFLDLPRSEPDRQLLTDPAIRSLYLNTVREAVRQGIDAYAWDGVLERRSWGFALVEVVADVWIFQGEQDAVVPRSQAQMLAAAMPTSNVRFFQHAGHGLIVAEWAEILSLMMTARPTVPDRRLLARPLMAMGPPGAP